MSDESSGPEFEPELDPELVENFERLEATPAPELWDSIVKRAAGTPAQILDTSPLIHKRWPEIAAAALVLAVAAATVAAIYNRDPAVVDVGDQEAPAQTTSAPSQPAVDGCVSSELAASLSQGMPTFDYEPSTSPADLVSQSPLVARGQIISASELAGGTAVLVKTADFTGPLASEEPRIINIWTPATIAPDDDFLGGSFVAFLNGETIPHPTGGDSLWPTYVEGFWVGCVEDGPAASVLVEPVADGWQDIKADGITLSELWQAAQFPDGVISVLLGDPTHTVAGTDVFDVRLTRGERFRLSLPQGLANGATVFENPELPGAVIAGPEIEAAIRYDFCEEPDGRSINSLGSEVKLIGSLVSVCRPDELLVMTVELTFLEDSESGVPFLDSWDIRPIVPAGTYGERLNEFRPELKNCGNCNPNGPTVYPDVNVVINRTGQTQFTGVALDTLEEVWTVDTEGFGTQMQAGQDAIYLSDPAGPFLKIDAATGNEGWRIEFPEEHNHSLSAILGDSILVQSSFSSEGDSRAPLLRRIDDASGEVQWTAQGREWGEWQWGRFVVIDGVVVLMDSYDNVPDPDAEPGGRLFGFDLETGNTLWETDLDVAPARFNTDMVLTLEFEDGQALLARTVNSEILRVDPASGQVLWITSIASFEVDGTDFDSAGNLAISLRTASGQVLLDPATGEVLP